MRIQGDNPNLPITTEKLDRTTDPSINPTTTRPAGPQKDTVELSADAQLAQSAVKATDALPAIRQDVVERMRAMLERGEIGNDTRKLADALISHMIENSQE